MIKYISTTTLLILLSFFSFNCQAQCCGGGGGSPIAGGSSQGVLQEGQMEINTNYQYIYTDQFYSKDKRDTNYFDLFSSQYSYTRIAFGVTKNFTISLETGYWLDKKEVDSKKKITHQSSGIGDVIIFPRYDIINKSKNSRRTELTVGMGVKIPLGTYNDSTKMIEPFSGDPYYITGPLSIQPSSGSNDLIFYSFFSRSNSITDFRYFANAMYVKKGWNPMGEKMGDYASVGLFVGKTFRSKLGVTLQLKGEWIDKMKLNEDIFMLYGDTRFDPEATGSKKVFIVPQLSYSFKDIVIYALSEIPIYQYVTKVQVGSRYQTTVGLSYRFMAKKKTVELTANPGVKF
jgi:hypothetical protein